MQTILEIYGSLGFPKDPCTYIVYTWALKGFLYSSFRAQVYTIQVHGSFGFGISVEGAAFRAAKLGIRAGLGKTKI